MRLCFYQIRWDKSFVVNANNPMLLARSNERSTYRLMLAQLGERLPHDEGPYVEEPRRRDDAEPEEEGFALRVDNDFVAVVAV